MAEKHWLDKIIEKYGNSDKSIIIRLKHITIILFMVFLLPIFCHAQNLPEFSDKLGVLEIKASVRSVKILYDPTVTTVINKEEPMKYNIQGIGGGIKVIRTIRTKISANTQDYYVIDFDEGASDDPTFVIYREKDKKLQYICYIPGTMLVIPGDGNLYISGHTNNMFDQRKKFKLKKGKIIEVPQPYYYVGLETKVKKRINIYSTLQQQEVVATLLEGAPVTVLLNRGKYYLLKTPFGIVGWIQIDEGSQETSIEGLYFAGD